MNRSGLKKGGSSYVFNRMALRPDYATPAEIAMVCEAAVRGEFSYGGDVFNPGTGCTWYEDRTDLRLDMDPAMNTWLLR